MTDEWIEDWHRAIPINMKTISIGHWKSSSSAAINNCHNVRIIAASQFSQHERKTQMSESYSLPTEPEGIVASKRHYEAIAEAMQEAHPGSQVLFDNVDNECFRTAAAAWQIACTELANKFARDNGQFNRECFIAACQPGANVRARTQYRITGVANPCKP